MGKNSKRKRQKIVHQLVALAVNATRRSNSERISIQEENEHEHESENETENEDDIITEEEIAITVQTLQRITQSAVHSLQDKRFKSLRRAIHPLVLQQLQSYDHGTDYRTKVTQALQHRKWTDALAALQGCHDFQQLPKQGTVQRWVRDCDMAPASCKLCLLNAILVVTVDQPSDEHVGQGEQQGSDINKHDPRLAIMEHVTAITNSGSGSGHPQKQQEPHQDQLQVLKPWTVGRFMYHKIPYDDLPEVHIQSRILYREAAADRKPPNHYDLILHTAEPGSIQWSPTNENILVKHDIPFLISQKGVAFLLENVFTLEECQQLRAAATVLGFRPDHPTSLDKPTGIDSCEWLVDDSILSIVNARVQPYLVDSDPDLLATHKDAAFYSINPRWRFFRYGAGCVYRPHIDGSWPASRINPQTGNYESYSEVDGDGNGNRGATIKSYHTFLIYLNDNFEGGHTRFYYPRNGALVAQGVMPTCGSVLVFSQGNMASLLHEGSAVTVGTKYVIRTDVLYRTTTTPVISRK